MREKDDSLFNLKKAAELFIKGIPIGMSNTLPGISGGTMALVLGIYETLVTGIKRIKFKVLIPIFLGAVVGVLGSAQVITSILESYPNLMKAFLLGLIFASSGVTLQQIKKINWTAVLLSIIGFSLAYFFSVEVTGAQVGGSVSAVRSFFGGAVGSVAMILPGVSGGTILIMMGLYEGVLAAINSFEFAVLIPFALGVGSGLLAFSWLLSYLLADYRSWLMAFLTGLILGSMRSVIPANIGEILGFAAGFIIIYLLGRWENSGGEA